MIRHLKFGIIFGEKCDKSGDKRKLKGSTS